MKSQNCTVKSLLGTSGFVIENVGHQSFVSEGSGHFVLIPLQRDDGRSRFRGGADLNDAP